MQTPAGRPGVRVNNDLGWGTISGVPTGLHGQFAAIPGFRFAPPWANLHFSLRENDCGLFDSQGAAKPVGAEDRAG
jgi:hypothetical protein